MEESVRQRKLPSADPGMLIDIGNELLQMGEFERAIELLEALIEREKGLTFKAKAYNSCGIAYAELGKYDKAIEYFEKAIELRRYLVDFGARTYFNLARVYEIVGNSKKAKECREKGEVLQEELYHCWVTQSDTLE